MPGGGIIRRSQIIHTSFGTASSGFFNHTAPRVFPVKLEMYRGDHYWKTVFLKYINNIIRLNTITGLKDYRILVHVLFVELFDAVRNVILSICQGQLMDSFSRYLKPHRSPSVSSETGNVSRGSLLENFFLKTY